MLPIYNFKIIILHKFKFVNSLYLNDKIIYQKQARKLPLQSERKVDKQWKVQWSVFQHISI